MTGQGTEADPWVLTTPPGMGRAQSADPQALICQVGGTQLKYHLRAIEDLHAMLVAKGDWIPLGGADERRPQRRAPSRPGAAPRPIRSAAGTA